MTRILASVDTTGPIPDAYNRAILTGAKYPGAVLETAGLQGAGPALLEGSNHAFYRVRNWTSVAKFDVIPE